MAGISGMFNTGRLSLFANQKALEVTSQNISNVGTPGYTRQEAVFQSTNPVDSQPGQTGTGVEISQIRRVVDNFMERQITSGESSFGRLQAEESLLSRIEFSFTDAEETGLSQALLDFFKGIQDLSTNPSDRPARTVLLEQAKRLAGQFSDMDAQFRQIQSDSNREVVGVLNEVNQFSAQVAALNKRIQEVELSGQNANDLRDQRQNLINAISERIDIKTFEDASGRVTLFVGSGKALVEGENAASLQGVADIDKGGFVNVAFDPGTGSTTDITSSITNGRLKGLIDVRDNVVPAFIDKLDQLSAGIINEVNQQHRVGYGLDSSTGNNFFSPLTPSSTAMSTNTGTGVLNVTVSNPAVLTLDQYDLVFSGGNYTLTNRNTGAASTPGGLPISFEGLTLSLSSGSPAAGDSFRLGAHIGSAGAMDVSLTNPDQIAAASTAAGEPGDNSNANLLALIQEKGMSSLGGDTLQEFYGGFVGEVGTRAQSAQRQLTVETGMRLQLKNMREETSGVSLDEEMTNMIKFQRAYEAAARVITTADELLQTILAIKR